MRKIAIVKNHHSVVKRVMIYEFTNGTYLFEYNSLEDSPATRDSWYQTATEAERACLELYHIGVTDWQIIQDPLEGCQHDWIAPVRVKGRSTGKPEWGVFEQVQNGVWREIS